MDVKNKKVLQSEATRAELIRVASDLFAERGYTGAALEDIVGKRKTVPLDHPWILTARSIGTALGD